jgi:hypothetical protein
MKETGKKKNVLKKSRKIKGTLLDVSRRTFCE